MSTGVTEAAKRVPTEGELDGRSLEQIQPAALRENAILAQQFSRRLLALAQQIAPRGSWSLEDLRDVLEVAVQGSHPEHPRVVEGRYLRKRVREHCAAAERYGDGFALVVIRLGVEPEPVPYERAIQAIVSRLRRSDAITVYRRRITLLLPRIPREALSAVIDRAVEPLGGEMVEEIVTLSHPEEGARDTQAVLDWLEDALR